MNSNTNVIVIFGGTGDLSRRKLIPALYHLWQRGLLVGDFSIIGAARSKLTDDEFRKRADQWLNGGDARFLERLFYQSVDATDGGSFAKLKKKIFRLHPSDKNLYFYLATAPAIFGATAAHLKEAGLAEEKDGEIARACLLVEKPFGYDLESSRELNSELAESFREDQMLRLDHYLGKETVQNMMVLRFGNTVFEPLWSNQFIDYIQICFAEDIGTGGRAGYFDKSGIIRDVIQNHLLQVLALTLIEETPCSMDQEDVRKAKYSVLKRLRVVGSENGRTRLVRGQYTQGYIGGSPVPGYREEDSGLEESLTETYACTELAVDGGRFDGVPVYIRAGKRMPRRVCELTVSFKAPSALCPGVSNNDGENNYISIQLQPEESVKMGINAKFPGFSELVRPAELELGYSKAFATDSPDAYERLLLEAIRGGRLLFPAREEIEESWRIVTPLLERNNNPVSFYPCGTWGPDESFRFMGKTGAKWRSL